MQIAALIFDELTPLDIVGPVEVLSRVPGIEVVIVASERRPVRDSRSHWILVPERGVDEVSDAARRLLQSLETARRPRDREVEATKARARARERFA